MSTEDHIIQLGEAIQKEIATQILSFIQNERRRRSFCKRFWKFVKSIRRCKLGCIEMECDEMDPPELVLPQNLRVSRRETYHHVDISPPSTPVEDGVQATLI
jgi:hypothetical protein